jgi:hypothetical protein
MPAIYDANNVADLLSKKVVNTREQRAELLRKALILDNNGDYLAQFFSAETVSKNKKNRLRVVK